LTSVLTFKLLGINDVDLVDLYTRYTCYSTRDCQLAIAFQIS
jgi:hypothetical protein